MNKSPLWIFIVLGICLGVSQSFFFLTPVVILSYFIFIKKILRIGNLKDSFFAGWSFGIGFYIGSMHWIISPFLIYEKHFLLWLGPSITNYNIKFLCITRINILL